MTERDALKKSMELPAKKTRKADCCHDCLTDTRHGDACACGCHPQPSHTPTPGKMREILVGMTHDGDVSDHTIMVALESNDDPLRAYIVRAVNAHEELLSLVKEFEGYALEEDRQSMVSRIQRAIAKAEGH